MKDRNKIGKVNWIGLYTLLKKEIKRFIKVYQQTVLAPAFTSFMFFLIISLALESRVKYDFNYIDFLAPGLIVMTMMQNSFANTSSSILGSKMQGNIVDLLMPPLNPNEIIFAYVTAATIRAFLIGIITFFIFLPFTNLEFNSYFTILFFAFFGSVLLALLGLVVGIWSEKFDNMSGITNFIITPLTFLSGTFYTIESLPSLFYKICLFNPFYYIIEGFRVGFSGNFSHNLIYGIIYLSILNLLMYIICYKILNKGWMLKP